MVNYQKSLIYKLCCKDTRIKDEYIGSTTCKDRRKNQHKTTCNGEKNKCHNARVYKFIRENGGWNNWDMVVIEEYPCDNKIQLLQRERYWMEIRNSTLNTDIPISDMKKYYRNREKEKIRDCKRIYNNVIKELKTFEDIIPQKIKEIYNQRRIRWEIICKIKIIN